MSTKPTRSEIVLASHRSERLVHEWLRRFLPEIKRAKYRDGFDLTYKEKLLEIKASSGLGGAWQFNIHRHGVLNEQGIHAYILRLEDVPGFKAAIHLVVPAPIGKPTILITMRGLLSYWARFFNRLDYIEKDLATDGHGRPRNIDSN